VQSRIPAEEKKEASMYTILTVAFGSLFGGFLYWIGHPISSWQWWVGMGLAACWAFLQSQSTLHRWRVEYQRRHHIRYYYEP
jgi:hypothetical protein